MFGVAWSKAMLASVSAAALAVAGFSPVIDDPAGCAAAGPTLRYLVLFAPGTDRDTARTEIAAGCGELSGYYPQIGVAVAEADNRDIVHRIGADRVYSAAAEALRGTDAGAEHGPLRASDVSTADTDRSAAQWDQRMISAEAAHLVSTGDRRVLVGVLDSGIDPNQPDLAAAVDRRNSAGCVTGTARTEERAWAASNSPHGTHIAGTIAAADDGSGVTGVAPGVRVASVKVVDEDGFIYPEAAVCGLMWAAARGMDVTNNSYYVDPWLFTCARTPGQHVVHEALRRAVGYATGAGVLNVAAATNTGLDLRDARTDSASPDNAGAGARTLRRLGGDCAVLPAGLPGTVTVSAVDEHGRKAGYSAYGLGVVDLTAPGGDAASGAGGCVLSTVPGGYGRLCGTSMAAPHVTGVAALLAALHPDADAAGLRRLLLSATRPLPCPDFYDPRHTGGQLARCTGDATNNSFYGRGLIDAAAAVRDDSLLSLLNLAWR